MFLSSSNKHAAAQSWCKVVQLKTKTKLKVRMMLHLETGAALHLQLGQRLPVLEVGQLPGVEPLAERLQRNQLVDS